MEVDKIKRIETDFNAHVVKNDCVKWIREWFHENGPQCNCIVGVSGGKDSAVVAALCAEALGIERVIGVTMPDGIQLDITDSMDLIGHLGIRHINADVGHGIDSIMESIVYQFPISIQAEINLPPRVRMATLYMISQTLNGRVANTCNLSEDYIGYSTRCGDSAGDFSPLANLTVTEVKAIGKELRLPAHLIDKPPADGLCGKTDEENLGFSYAVLDQYIRTGICEDKNIEKKIEELHQKNKFKMEPMPSFYYSPSIAPKNMEIFI